MTTPTMPDTEFASVKAMKQYFPLVDDLAADVSGFTARVMPTDVFETIKDVKRANQIMWSEFLDRTYLVAATSILRFQRWTRGVTLGLHHGNYLVFAASLRGLLEAGGDTAQILFRVPISLAQQFSQIRSAINGTLATPMLSTELEEELQHYFHAKKHPRKAAVPEHLRAKEPWEYVAILDKARALDPASAKALADLYAQLCQMVHPAEHSLPFFHKDGDNSTLVNDGDAKTIARVVEAFDQPICELIMMSINCCLITFKLLNAFGVDRLRVARLDKTRLDKIPLWSKVESHLTSAQSPVSPTATGRRPQPNRKARRAERSKKK